MFTYLDRDLDNYLRYNDFVTLVQEGNTLDFSSLNLLLPADEFSKSKRYSEKGSNRLSNTSHVNSHLNEYTQRRQTTQTQKLRSIHTPQFNSVDPYNFTPSLKSTVNNTSASQSGTAGLGSIDATVPVFGSSSHFINEHGSIFSKINRGNMQAVISNDYQKDYLIEMKMKDDR